MHLCNHELARVHSVKGDLQKETPHMRMKEARLISTAYIVKSEHATQSPAAFVGSHV